MNKALDDTLPSTVRIDLQVSAKTVIEALENQGFEAWVVGGCVRDALLGRGTHDVDIATNAHWKQVSKAAQAAGMSAIPTGVAHGTVTLVADGEKVEVTTYRADGPYDDNRHPSSVSFVSTIDEDLARRDFTINAIAYHPARGVRDPFGGRDDLRTGTIRAVGNPRERFAEDALRIARAVRFAAELGFSIEDATCHGAEEALPLIERVAAERIQVELTKLLCGEFACTALLAYPSIIDALLPELAQMRGFDQKSPYHIYDVYEHTARVVGGVKPSPLLRWAALLHDAGKPDAFTVDERGRGHFYGHARKSEAVARSVMMRLRQPKALTHDVCLLVLHHDMHRTPSPKSVRRMLDNLDGRVELFFELCSLQRSDALAHAPDHHERAELADQMRLLLEQMIAEGQALSVRDLAINGKDAIAAGIEPGPAVGEVLERAFDCVVGGKLENTYDALFAFAQKAAAGDSRV